MPDVLDPNAIMFTPFEPKAKNRFVMEVNGLDSWLIKAANRPTINFDEMEIDHINTKHYLKGKGVWEPLEISLYDPLEPSAATAVMDWVRLSHESITGVDGYAAVYKKNVTIKLFDPVGLVLEKWSLKGAWIQNANFNDLDWANSTDPVDISVTLRFDYAILEF